MKLNRMGENCSFVLTCHVKNVPVYDFRLILGSSTSLSVKQFLKMIY